MIENMSVKELKTKIENGDNIKLIDCREQAEWDEGHIQEAQLMPLSSFAQNLEKLDQSNKDQLIVIQCRSGKRSLQACMILQGEGFQNLFNLQGGILAWNELNYPTI